MTNETAPTSPMHQAHIANSIRKSIRELNEQLESVDDEVTALSTVVNFVEKMNALATRIDSSLA